VDFVYVAIELIFVALGAFWLAQLAENWAREPCGGLRSSRFRRFAVSLDRMTIDLPLAALLIGLVLYGQGEANRRWAMYAILCAAPLVRETGMVAVVAWCIYSAFRRDWRSAAKGAACGLPALAWWAYVQSRTPVDGTRWLASYPYSGILTRTLEASRTPPTPYGSAPPLVSKSWPWRESGLPYCWPAPSPGSAAWGWSKVTAILFAAFAGFLGKIDIWSSAYATGRTMSPLLLMLGPAGFAGAPRAFCGFRSCWYYPG